MSLNILIAGCLPKDRRQIEGVVKKAFGNIPESDPWSVSLVKMGSSWSISMERENQVLSLTAPEDRLRETIAQALGANGTANPPSPLPNVTPAHSRHRVARPVPVMVRSQL